MFPLRNLIMFWGQGRRFSSSGYCRFLHQTRLSRVSDTNNNQIAICKNSNSNRKKGKLKTGIFDRENCKFLFCRETESSTFPLFEEERPLVKALVVDTNNIPESGSSPDLLSVRTNTSSKKSRGPSFMIPTKTAAGRVYNRNLLCGLLPIGKNDCTYGLNEDKFSTQIRRRFHSSETSFSATKKSGKQPPRSSSSSSSSSSTDPWLSLEGYRIYPWSISGLETSVVVRAEHDKKFGVTFDLGYSTRPSLRCQNVFISHGHMDHVSGLFQHATKRNLYNLPPATYYVPPHLVEPLRKVGQQLHSLSGTPDILLNLDIRPVQTGDSVLVTPDYKICPFATIHRVPSQGYLLYRRYKRLKQLYQHLRPKEIAAMETENGEEKIYEVSWFPELAYTGDTTFELFLNNPPADLLKVRVLILEATYLESVTPGLVNKARERGHTHIAEVIEHANIFADIEKIVPIHMSDKYSSSFAREAISFQLPQALLKKIVISTLAKDRT